MGNMVEERRIGTFEIEDRFIWEQPEMVKKFLAGFLIVRAAARFENRSVVYDGYCELFEPVPRGERPVRYEMIFKRDEVGNKTEAFDQLVKCPGKQ